MKNLHLDLKTSFIHSKIIKSNYLLLALGFFVCIIATPEISFGEVFIPSHEYVSYFDSNGIYTVVGNVKNNLEYAIIPTITVSVENNSQIFSKTIQHVPLAPGTEIPFKIKFFEKLDNPILLPADLFFERTLQQELPIAILYDETLIRENKIKELGYNLVTIWEYDWKKINRCIKILQNKFRKYHN